LSNCDVAVNGTNDGLLGIVGGSIELAGDGFDLKKATVRVQDILVGVPTSSRWTGKLADSSTLDLINSTTPGGYRFDFGAGDNIVNFYWYLNLTLKYLSNGSPLSDAKVSARESTGALVLRDANAGVDGVLEELVLRHRSLNPDETVHTPHAITVSKDSLRDSFTIEVDQNRDHTFYLDNYPPDLSILSPEEGTIFNVSTVTLSGEAMDARVTETEGLRSMSYRVDNGTWLPIDLPTVREWSVDIEIGDGVHVVEVRVIDNIGNGASASVMFEVDTEPPSLAIISPTEDVFTKEPSIVVIGRSEPGALVTVNGEPIELSDSGDFNITLTLTEGMNRIVVVAIDELGNGKTLTIQAILDTTPPEVDLNLPSGEWWTSSDQVEIEGTKEANTSISVDTERPEFFTLTSFSVPVTLVEGINSFTIISEDSAGNSWSTTVLIYRDTVAPSLSVQALPTHTSTPTISVSGSTDDPAAIVNVNDQAITLTGNAFAASVSLNEGMNTIVITARDPLDNEADPVTLEVILDTVPPSLTISTKKYIKTVKDEQNLSGETEPGLSVIVSVIYGGYSKTYDVVAGDDGSFWVEVRLPQLGNHSVTVTVDDLAGNRAQDTLSFDRVRGTTPPPPPPPGDNWFKDNWEWVVLAVSIIASVLVLFISMMPKKRRPSQGQLAPQEEEEGPPVDEDAEEEWEEEEVAEWEED
jgi:hypothetical protein